MSRPLGIGRTAVATAVVAVALLFAGCASASDEGGADTDGTSAETDDTTSEEEEGSGDEEGSDDGEEDPAQDRVRTGPVAEYGGPAYGDQGGAEIIEPGVWCETLALFWGGEPVPEGVRFTFTEAVVDTAGLEVTGAACGTDPGTGEPLAACLGLPLEANASAFCGLEVRPGPDFVDGTGITFIGTLECPSAEVCDAVVAREVDPGPPVVVNTPDGA
jgi:hypothetical protein